MLLKTRIRLETAEARCSLHRIEKLLKGCALRLCQSTCDCVKQGPLERPLLRAGQTRKPTCTRLFETVLLEPFFNCGIASGRFAALWQNATSKPGSEGDASLFVEAVNVEVSAYLMSKSAEHSI